jgi:hypothetical protein
LKNKGFSINFVQRYPIKDENIQGMLGNQYVPLMVMLLNTFN